MRIGCWRESQRVRPLGGPRRRWVDLLELGLGVVEWIGLVQDRNRWKPLVNLVLNLQVP
jgi:hypothetical protein